MGWAGIGIPTMDRRIDIRVEANAALLTAMAARMVGEGSSETLNPHNLMAEIANLVRGHVQGQLQRYGHTSNISVLSRCFDARSLTTAGAESERPKQYVLQPMSLKVISISPFASSALSVPPLSNAKPVKKRRELSAPSLLEPALITLSGETRQLERGRAAAYVARPTRRRSGALVFTSYPAQPASTRGMGLSFAMPRLCFGQCDNRQSFIAESFSLQRE